MMFWLLHSLYSLTWQGSKTDTSIYVSAFQPYKLHWPALHICPWCSPVEDGWPKYSETCDSSELTQVHSVYFIVYPCNHVRIFVNSSDTSGGMNWIRMRKQSLQGLQRLPVLQKGGHPMVGCVTCCTRLMRRKASVDYSRGLMRAKIYAWLQHLSGVWVGGCMNGLQFSIPSKWTPLPQTDHLPTALILSLRCVSQSTSLQLWWVLCYTYIRLKMMLNELQYPYNIYACTMVWEEWTFSRQAKWCVMLFLLYFM